MIFFKKEKKIFLAKEEGLSDVLKRLKKTKARKIIFVFPPGSKFIEQFENFEILKKEAALNKKELVIESTDSYLLQIAASVGLFTYHSIFGVQEKMVADILSQKPIVSKKIKEKEKKLEKEKETKKEIKLKTEKPSKIKELKELEEVPLKKHLQVERKKSKAFHFSWLLAIGIIIILIFGGYQLAFNILPKATITLEFQKQVIDFEKGITVSSKTLKTQFQNDNIEIPGELLIYKKNAQIVQKASGRQKVETKASGKLVIFNSYSSASQILVAGTRFQSPEGKIFRLTERVKVPGAEIVAGEIKPSSLEVLIVADQPGAEFNIEKPTIWHLPAFKGTVKYEKIYGQSFEPITNGFIGEKAVPTDSDILEIKNRLVETLKNSLETDSLLALKDKFTLLEGANDFQIIKEEINPQTDENGNFSIFGEAQKRYLVFEESVLKEAIISKIKNEYLKENNFQLKEFDFIKEPPSLDLENGQMNFKVKGRAVFKPIFDPAAFKNQISGLKEEDLKNILSSLPNIYRVQVSFWPFWVHRVPENVKNIEVKIE